MGHLPVEQLPVEQRLQRHLRSWLGQWPVPVEVVRRRRRSPTIVVVGSDVRELPGWDGRVRILLGVGTPDSLVLSVPPELAERVHTHAARAGWAGLRRALPRLLDHPEQRVYSGVFRWSDEPAALPDAGTWVDADDPTVPAWLRPFGHQVLITRDDQSGVYLAGVGIKHHDRYGRELAVGTEPAARGRGLARRLVAQAARRVLDQGAVPTYQHDRANVASARVADAAGFPDRGWWSVGLW